MQIAQGAEAKIFSEKIGIVKDRFVKGYRLEVIDRKLRRSRTKREAKVLGKLTDAKFPAPKLISQEESKLVMEEIKGSKVRDILEGSDYIKLSKEIGKKIATLHEMHIIHGDLTTSNMILSDEIYFIDFGLSFFSHKIEDRAVELHLLKQALESKHHTIWEKCFDSALKSYVKNSEDGKLVLTRLEKVEGRGRYKGKKSH